MENENKNKNNKFFKFARLFCQQRLHYSREEARVEALKDNNACVMFQMVWQVLTHELDMGHN